MYITHASTDMHFLDVHGYSVYIDFLNIMFMCKSYTFITISSYILDMNCRDVYEYSLYIGLLNIIFMCKNSCTMYVKVQPHYCILIFFGVYGYSFYMHGFSEAFFSWLF